MKKTLFALALALSFGIYGQEESATEFLDFASKSENDRKFVLLNRWEPKGISREVSESGDSFIEEVAYTISYEGKSYDLTIGSSISLSENSESKVSIGFEMKLNNETEFNSWMNELKDLGIEFDKYEDFGETGWSSHLYSPIYRFDRIFLIKKKNGNSFEYIVHVD